VLGRLWLAGRACVWVLRVEWLRRRLPFDQLVEALESWPQPPRSLIQADRALTAVGRVYRLSPFKPSCLKSSLAAVGLLRSLGHPARLAIGIKPVRGPVEAHAWVELDGKPLSGENAGYARMFRPDS